MRIKLKQGNRFADLITLAVTQTMLGYSTYYIITHMDIFTTIYR